MFDYPIQNKKVLIIKGGPSSEFEVSLKTGKNVSKVLEGKYKITECTIDKEGNWIINGVSIDPRNTVLNHDVIFNAMHGEYGEDGTVQSLLEKFGVPFTGSKSLGSKLSINKFLSKKIYKSNNLKTPQGLLIERTDNLDRLAVEIFRTFPMPVIIKPVDKGSSVGVSVARDYHTLMDTLKSLFVYHDKLLIEEFIEGKEATIGVIEDFRNQKHYSLLPIEIRTPKHKSVFDYEAKYSGITHELCPGNFSTKERFDLQEMAKEAHRALGLRQYSRSDFIVHPRRGIYILETNSLPGLTQESLMPKGIYAVGSSLQEFLDHLIHTAKN